MNSIAVERGRRRFGAHPAALAALGQRHALLDHAAIQIGIIRPAAISQAHLALEQTLPTG
jgi:hypothetical protein